MTDDTLTEQSLDEYCSLVAEQARAASFKLPTLDGTVRTKVLKRIAALLRDRKAELVAANGKDIARKDEFGLSDAMVERLTLNDGRIEAMARSVDQIADQVDPIGQVIEGFVRPNGMRIEKVRVPLGVVFFIYESRPNVTSDAAALCIKSGNALILRGGKEAFYSNTAIAKVIQDAIEAEGVDPNIVQLVSTTDREAVGKFLKLEGLIDVCVPRGGEGLIRAVVEQARIPVIKHYTGNCHVYVDEFASGLPDGMVRDVCVNAKTQRVSVCNATETILFHPAACDLLEEVATALADRGVLIHGCTQTVSLLRGKVADDKLTPATDEDWGTEYLDLQVAIKVVANRQEAIAHINRYGSHHTDAILSADVAASEEFVTQVDSGSVMVNCSTRFSDGGEYGLGAEIGISTDKLHARGPVGAPDMTTYKWVVRGYGQTRG